MSVELTGRRWGDGLKPRDRIMVTGGSALLGLLVCYGMVRGLMGIAPPTPWIRETALAIHMITVIPALPLGAYLLLSPKGTPRHRLLGKLWLALMLVTATASLGIRNVNNGSFSFIHLFVPFTYYASIRAIIAVRKGDIATHRSEVVSLFIGALLIAGFATFLPGRTMWILVFG